MANFACPLRGGKTKGRGRTASGAKRWQCMSCKTVSAHSNDNAAKSPSLLKRLLSKKTQSDTGMPARAFRRQTARSWALRPFAPVRDEARRTVFADGTRPGRDAVVLVACTQDHVIGWHLARSEHAQARAALMARIATPDVVVTDGGQGFEKARRSVRPRTRVQRRAFHAFCQAKRQTTTRPKLEAGAELYGIAKDLLHAGSLDEAAAWLARFSSWRTRWEGFLKEKTAVGSRAVLEHERLRRARRGLEKLARAGTLLACLDEEPTEDGPVPATSNVIEGGVNRQLRVVLDEHCGMRLDRRAKAVFWWCYMHT